jgi:hypothetical protein
MKIAVAIPDCFPFLSMYQHPNFVEDTYYEYDARLCIFECHDETEAKTLVEWIRSKLVLWTPYQEGKKHFLNVDDGDNGGVSIVIEDWEDG